jgi:hypothetical protein
VGDDGAFFAEGSGPKEPHKKDRTRSTSPSPSPSRSNTGIPAAQKQTSRTSRIHPRETAPWLLSRDTLKQELGGDEGSLAGHPNFIAFSAVADSMNERVTEIEEKLDRRLAQIQALLEDSLEQVR